MSIPLLLHEIIAELCES